MRSIDHIMNVFDLISYTSTALRESGYMEDEIECYVSEALEKCSNFEIVELSKQWLEECNKLYSDSSTDNMEDYYQFLWDEDCCDEIDREEDVYDYLTGSYRKKEIWEYDNAVDDVEAYEGFNSCKTHYWNAYDDEL